MGCNSPLSPLIASENRKLILGQGMWSYLIFDCIVHSIISPADVTITDASKASTLYEPIGSNGSLVQRSSIGPSLSGSTRFLWRGTWHKNWHRFLLWWSL